MHHWNNISIKKEHWTALQCITKPAIVYNIVGRNSQGTLILTPGRYCLQLPSLVQMEQNVHFNIAITSLIWLTMLKLDKFKDEWKRHIIRSLKMHFLSFLLPVWQLATHFSLKDDGIGPWFWDWFSVWVRKWPCLHHCSVSACHV